MLDHDSSYTHRPYNDDISFLLCAFILKDLGVTLYKVRCVAESNPVAERQGS